MSTTARPSDVVTLRRVFRQARPFWPKVGLVFAIDLLAAPLALLTPIPLKIAVDSVINSSALTGMVGVLVPSALASSKTALLATAAALVILIAAVNRIRALYATSLRTRTGNSLQLSFRAALFEHAQRLSLAHHDEKGTNDATYRILYDTPAVQHLTVSALPQLVGAALTFLSMAYVTAAISPRLVVVALLISPILVALGWWHRGRVSAQWKLVKLADHSAYAVAQESFNELRLVKAFGQEERERDRFLQQSMEGMEALRAVQNSEGMFQLLVGVTTAVGSAAVLWLGAQSVLDGTITVGALLVVMAYLTQLYAPLETIGSQVTAVQNSLTMADRAFSLLDRQLDVVDRDNPVRVATARGAIAFDEVSFAYRANEPILRDLTLTIPAGSRVGIAGRTGAGKSTLLNLLVRFYDPQRGRVLIDGVDLKDYALEDLRRQFSIVLQETLLFSVSVEENLRYARTDASREEVEAAARAANVHDVIAALPDGYATQVGQRGMRLSGGERQRISLARAFLRNAPILILDEPTSAVDIATERTIVEAMERLMDGRTTFMVAHRLSTLATCDRLLVLDAGRLIASTTDVKALLDEAAALGSVEAAAYRFAGAGAESR